MSEPTSSAVSVVADTIMRTVELGVTITDAAIAGESTMVFCDLLTSGADTCRDCDQPGTYRDTAIRRLTDVPVAGHPLRLEVRVPRYRCTTNTCGREIFAHNTARLAHPGSSTTRRCGRHVLRRLMIDRMTITAVARELGLSWDTVNTIAVEATQTIVADDPHRLDGVRAIGVDEHRWAHRRGPGGGFVTMIVDLTPIRDGTGPSRLIDIVPGRSAQVLTTWLSARTPEFRAQVEVVSMDGFGGYKTAATDQLPDATAVMDPFHVIALAGAKLDICRQRTQQHTLGRRGRSGDPLYRARRTLRTRVPLLTARQHDQLVGVFDDDNHLAVAVTWNIYQKMIAAYANPDPHRGKTAMTAIIESLRREVPAALEELAQLGRTLWRRRTDVLAYFDHHTSNGPTEAINGRLKALRRNALGFRNPTNYRTRSLLHSGNLAHRIDAL